MEYVVWYVELFTGCALLFILMVFVFSAWMQRTVFVESQFQSAEEDGLWTHNTIDIEPTDVVRMQQANESTQLKNADAKTNGSNYSWHDDFIRDIG